MPESSTATVTPVPSVPACLHGRAADIGHGFGQRHFVVDDRPHLGHARNQCKLLELRRIDADSDRVVCDLHTRQLFGADAGETDRDLGLLCGELAAIFRQRLGELPSCRAGRELLGLLDARRCGQLGLLRGQRWCIHRDPHIDGSAGASQSPVNSVDSDAGGRGWAVSGLPANPLAPTVSAASCMPPPPPLPQATTRAAVPANESIRSRFVRLIEVSPVVFLERSRTATSNSCDR